MNFIQNLYAQTAAEQPPPDPTTGFLLQLPIFIALFGLFYFGLIRPQKNQQKKQAAFLTSLKKGDEVVTTAGVLGTITGITERVVTLDVGEGSEIKVLRSYIHSHFKDANGQVG